MQIVPITSEEELQEGFFRLFREKKAVSIAMEYLGEGADYYYSFYDNLELPNYDESTSSNYVEFFKKHLDKPGKTAFVSLGCGNAFYEKPVLAYMQREGRDFSYFGVDSSHAMLLKAQKNLESLDLPGELLCADFGSDEFFRQMLAKTEGFERRIFGSFGGTLGCIDMEYLSNVFSHIMRPGDMLWFDVSVRPSLDADGDRKVAEHYRRYAEEPTNNDLDFSPLKKLGVSKEDGEFGFLMSHEDDTGALRFDFTFDMKKPFTVAHPAGDVELAAGDTVYLSSIRSYDPDGLAAFLNKKGLDFVAKDLTVDMQFLFVKR